MIMDDLTVAQREAVTHFEGPLLVLAGAGSGKTRVITRRIAHLIHEGVKPWSILAITFTNKAAGEMRQRVEALVPGSKVWISTFHSLGARLLRQYAERLNLDRSFTIYDVDDRTRLVKSALETTGIDSVRFPPERIESAISKAKNQLLGPKGYSAKATDFFTMTVAQVYPIYEKKLRDANAVDFDDLLLLPALALRHDADLRAELDARFRFVLIDEYQDTNTAQYAIARGLTLDHPNLCVVGDPDQSIYKWRGSDIRNILDFERDYPDARVILLDRNYRSSKAILRAASHLIAHNKQRKPKDLFTDNAEGQPVTVLTFDSGQDEADGIAQRIKGAVDAGERRFLDFAIFLRINALSRALEEAFLKHRVPYQIVRGLAFFERKENKDVLAYLRLLLNPRDDLAFLRVVNEPARGIGKVSLDHLKQYAEPRELSLLSAAAEVAHIPAIKGKAAAALRGFAQLIRDLTEFKDATPDEVIRQVLDRTGYRKMLQKSVDQDDQDRLANIEEMITAAGQFAAQDSSRTLSDFLEDVTLASDVDSWDDRQDCVSVMTLHAAKGLEFPVVYMVAVEQGLLPHERSLRDKVEEDLEEERRLAFVGMTRAKEELYLSQAKVRRFRGMEYNTITSMFIEEMPEGVETINLGNNTRTFDDWRGGSDAAAAGWIDAGFEPPAAQTSDHLAAPRSLRDAGRGQSASRKSTTNSGNVTLSELRAPPKDGDDRRYIEGMLVRHETYGHGRVTEVSGYGALRKVKIRFSQGGERTFLVDKAKLTVVSRP